MKSLTPDFLRAASRTNKLLIIIGMHYRMERNAVRRGSKGTSSALRLSSGFRREHMYVCM